MRKLKTVGIVAGAYLFGVIIEFVLAFAIADYNGGIFYIYALTLLAVAAPRVGYRWFDCFFALIPVYGIFFIFRIAYRIAYLPNKDWTERISSDPATSA